MTLLIPVTLFGWVPFVMVLFALLPPRRAMIAAYLAAWLFLPMAGYDLPVLPPFNKMTATGYGVLLAAFVYHFDLLTAFRFKWFDVPAAVLCLVTPMAASLTNGLGTWDGLASTVETTLMWGLPYFLGRVFFRDAEGLRELAVGLFIGGLIYAPLCVYEIRMSPQLHRMVYGVRSFDWLQVQRFGGWRPTVFMQHGLMVGMWMGMTMLAGAWLWWRGWLTRLGPAPMIALVGGMALVVVLCKSFGALGLVVMGGGALLAAQKLNHRWPLVALLALAPGYMVVRSTDLWRGEGLLDAVAMVSEERMRSFEFRLINEDMLVDKELERPVFGWGGWGRARVYDASGRDLTVTDGMWVIVLGERGVIGVAALFGMLLLPLGLLLRRHTAAELMERGPPALVLSVIVCLYAIDCLPNGMVNPIFTLAGGAVLGALAQQGALAAAPEPVDAVGADAEPTDAATPGPTPPRRRSPGQFVPLSQRL